jgi:hypothetical protein
MARREQGQVHKVKAERFHLPYKATILDVMQMASCMASGAKPSSVSETWKVFGRLVDGRN